MEYSCEICGNFVYKGRKAFDKHFQEWRHAHGMRCLGIPNTRQFHEIVGIEDALACKFPPTYFALCEANAPRLPKPDKNFVALA